MMFVLYCLIMTEYWKKYLFLQWGYGFPPVSMTYSSSNFKHVTLKLKFSHVSQKILPVRI
jgi:hypothetical protein